MNRYIKCGEIMEVKLTPQILTYIPHFAAIVRQKNLARAAQDLNISAPAMTHALNKLEDLLGLTLCIRNRAVFKLTSEGERLAKVASSIMLEMSNYAAGLDEKSQCRGHLCIGVIDEFENEVFQETLKWMTSRFGEAFFSLVVLPSEDILARLSTGELDAGFGIFNEHPDDLNFIKIGESQLHYYLSKAHPLFKEKADRDSVRGMSSVWIDNEVRSRVEVENEVFKERPRYRLKIRAFTNNTSLAMKLVETGAFIAPLPADAVKRRGSTAFKRVSISKGPVTLREEFVFNPRINAGWLKSELVNIIRTARATV